MNQTACQVSIDPSQIKPTLEKIGYRLIDCGNHWRTKALYRGGDNSASVRVYKNTGVWTDFAQGSQSYPFEKLIKISCNSDTKTLKEIISSLNKSDEFVFVKKDLIEMDTIYPDGILNNLFSNFSFYKKKGISEETLKFYKTGLAQSGKMYRRMVFPIYNEHSQIIGFGGRKIDEESEAPKWKLIGRKRNWIYPAHIPNEETVDSLIRSSGEVDIVESIGDSLALFESGIKNNLVSFGVGCSPSLISYLSSFPIKKITISGNNDEGKDKNYGKIGSVKTLLTLLPYFDFDRLEIKMPPSPHNDLFDAYTSGVDLKNWYNTPVDRTVFIQELKDTVSENQRAFNPKEVKILNKILKNYEQS
jgi:hypothetical protein